MKHIPLLLLLFFAGLVVQAQDAAVKLYEEGLALKKDKKIKEAVDKFRQAVALKTDYYQANYEIGWCSNDLKDYTTAMAALKKARPFWPDMPKVHFELGYAFEKLGFKDSAKNCYNKAITLKSDYSLAHKQLGVMDYIDEDYTNALMHFAAYEAAERGKGYSIEDYLYWYRKGFSQNALKLYEEAKISLAKCIEKKSDYINGYLEMGFACNKLKQGDEAISYFQQAIDLDPKSHIPYNGIGEVYRDTKKDIDMAMTWYQKSLSVKKDERKACFGMGYCLNSKGRYSDAIPYLEKAIEQENTYTAAYVELGYSLYMTSRNEEALEKLNKAVSLNPKNENSRYYAGLIYINQQNKPKAQQMVDELKVLGSKNAVTLQEKVNKM